MKRGRKLQTWLKKSLIGETALQPAQQQQVITDNNSEVSSLHDDALLSPTCLTIDDAMNALYESSCEQIQDAQDFQAYTPLPEAHDWILDGHVSFPPEQERSRQLLQELKGPSLEEIAVLVGEHNSQDLVNEETEENENEENEATISDDDEEFGEFQTANDAPSPKQQEQLHSAPLFVDTTDQRAKSQEADGACRLEQQQLSREGNNEVSHRLDPDDAKHQEADNEAEEEEETLGDTGIPREIFHTPLHVEHTLHDLEGPIPEEGLLYDTVQDVSSPEGRFTRRQYLLQHGDDTDENDDHTEIKLPEHYFSNPQWDVVLDTLRSMPWQQVPLLSNDTESSSMDVQDYITTRLSQVDAMYSQVVSQLLRQASLQTSTLTKGNAVIHEMSFNLKMSQMYVERSQDSITEARGSKEECTGVVGAEMLLQEFDLRDDYQLLQLLLEKIANALDMEQELNECIHSFGTNASITHEIVLERARQLNETVYEDEDLRRLECLDDLRLRSNQVLKVFRNEIEDALCSYIDKLCHDWSICSDTEYERLFRALFAVHQVRLENGQVQQTDESLSQVVETWSTCILETLCFQADKCFARALLDPTDSLDSEYDKELITLEYELKQDSRDAVKLISLTHNLVTIRFDFEASSNYLPMVYHRLCALLTEVLHAHYVLSQHHVVLQAQQQTDKKVTRLLVEIETAIRSAKVNLWQQCEQVLAKCLDQYHNFAAKKTLFLRDNEDDDDGTVWMEDLEGLHDVLRLTQQFLSLGHEFLDSDQLEAAQVTSLTDFKADCDLREKLCEAFRKHLRAIHVEAMTTLGGSLFNESWRLVPLNVDRIAVSGRTGSDAAPNKRQLVQEHLLSALEGFKISDSKERYWQNELSTRESDDCSMFATIKIKGNPFLLRAQAPRRESDFVDRDHVSLERPESKSSPQRQSSASADGTEKDLLSSICKLIDNEHTVIPPIATESVNTILVKWASRLLTVMLKLPLVIEDVTKIFRDLFDLYFITAFRLCAGNGRNEKIILGLEEATPVITQEELEQGIRSPRSTPKRESSGFMGFGRRPSNSSTGHRRRGSTGSGRGSGAPTIVSCNAAADVCAPLPSDSEDISQLRDFIVDGQINLQSVVKLSKLEQRLRDPVPQSAVVDTEFIAELGLVLKKRQAIAWSCLLVAALLDVARRHIEQTLIVSFLNDMLGVNGSQATSEDEESISLLDSLVSYSETATRVAPHMVDLSSRISCVHAILGERIVTEIISVDLWEESRLNEHSNHYVDETCDRYALLWHSLSSAPSALPRGILEVTWEHICEGGYLSLLEGFSRVPFCSTEGRSLMSMDLAAFSDGIDAASIIHRLEADKVASSPPLVSSKRSMRYVDTYIKVFYYPEEDVMKWIVSNYRDYQMNHMLALLTCGSSDREAENTDIKKLANSIQALYADSPRSGEGSAQRQEK